VHRLLRGPALTVDRHARNGRRQARSEGGRPCDVAGLGADLIEASVDHVIDRRRVDPGTFDQRGDHVRAEISRVHLGESALAPTHGGTDSVDDVGLGHESSSWQ